MAQQVPTKSDPTYDKSQVGKKSQEGNTTVTDVPKAELEADAKRQGPVKDRDTVEGKAKKPASSAGSDNVAPIVKQNQDTDSPAISIVPPVYGHKGVMSLDQKDPWKLAEAKAQHRYGLEFINDQPKARQKELIEAEFRRLHNGTLDPDQRQTRVVDDTPQE